MAMCEPCGDLWMRWLDYTLPPAPIRLDGTGIRTARDVADYQEWRDTIRTQQDSIKAACAAGQHVSPRE